jgi:hypothetical protein
MTEKTVVRYEGVSHDRTKVLLSVFIPEEYCVLYEFNLDDMIKDGDHYLPSMHYFNHKVGKNPSHVYQAFRSDFLGYNLCALRKDFILEVPEQKKIHKLKSSTSK